MQAFARAGILTGTCFMPILPGLCDDDTNLENVVRKTAENGGKFVLAGSLTLADQQKSYFFKVLEERFPELVNPYQQLYPPGSYAPASYPWQRIALRIRQLCAQYGISDRIPRPIIPGDKHAGNKRIVEKLANKIYEMELYQEPDERTWAYRKGAWAIEDLEQDLGLIYQTMGINGLQNIPNIGLPLGKIVESMLAKVNNLPTK